MVGYLFRDNIVYHPGRGRQMRKLIFSMLVLILALTGCGGNNKSSELDERERLALDYVNSFLNETSEEARNAYLETHIQEEYQIFYKPGSPMPDGPLVPAAFPNPKVYKSTSSVTNEENGEAIWLKGDEGKELLVLIIDGKVAYGFDNYSGSIMSMAGFEPLKRDFDK
jgi:hypothetical protein